jgi:hypothetical protein
MARVVDDIASSIPWQQAFSGNAPVGLTFTAYPEHTVETDTPADVRGQNEARQRNIKGRSTMTKDELNRPSAADAARCGYRGRRV